MKVVLPADSDEYIEDPEHPLKTVLRVDSDEYIENPEQLVDVDKRGSLAESDEYVENPKHLQLDVNQKGSSGRFR